MEKNPKNPAHHSSSKDLKKPIQKIAALFTDMKGSTTYYKKHGFKNKIFKFEEVLNDNYQFLSNFPYQRVLPKKDFNIRDNFKTLIDMANQTANAKSSRDLSKLSELIFQLKKTSSQIILNQKRLEIVNNTIFAVEFSLKTIFVFIFPGALTTFVFTSVLVIYKMYENSTSSLSEDDFSRVLRFGICAGVIFTAFINGF
jgi:hypothetical protein